MRIVGPLVFYGLLMFAGPYVLSTRLGGQLVKRLGSLRLFSSSSPDPTPTNAFLLTYRYVEGILSKRTPHRASHLALLNDLKDKGLLKAAGGGEFIYFRLY